MPEMTESPSSPDTVVSVCIPTYNGERFLEETVHAVLTQRLPGWLTLELLVIDSGSTDDTLSILGRFGDRITLHHIPNSEFSHGGTRDRLAHLATGAFVVFLTQDATPAHDRWLVKMIEPFMISPRVGCVYGRQRPRSSAAVSIRREVTGAFEPRAGEVVLSASRSLVDGLEEREPESFFSDVNSAARRDLLVGDVPFRHVAYSEDLALAVDMQRAGYLKAYTSDADVWHSNEFGVSEYFTRKLEENLGRARSLDATLRDSRVSLLLGWIKPTIRDWAFLLREEASWRIKLRGALDAPLYNCAAKAARFRASRLLARPRPAGAGEMDRPDRLRDPA